MKLVDLGKDARWKLMPSDHKEIKFLSNMGVDDKTLTAMYKISHQQISKIIDRNKTKTYWSKLTAKRNLKKYRTSPSYRKQCSLIKSRVWFKRKKLELN